jgi:hypothetical protein
MVQFYANVLQAKTQNQYGWNTSPAIAQLAVIWLLPVAEAHWQAPTYGMRFSHKLAASLGVVTSGGSCVSLLT